MILENVGLALFFPKTWPHCRGRRPKGAGVSLLGSFFDEIPVLGTIRLDFRGIIERDLRDANGGSTGAGTPGLFGTLSPTFRAEEYIERMFLDKRAGVKTISGHCVTLPKKE